MPDPPGPPGPAPTTTLQPLPPLSTVLTTATQTLVPVRDASPGDLNPALPENTQAFVDLGLGELVIGPGEERFVRGIDDGEAPPPGPNARRLVRFVHLPDLQLADDESPTRASAVDSQVVGAALRPQEPVACRMLNAAARTVNGLHHDDALDFVLLGGDNADSAQENEVRWVLDIFSGQDVECDSGDDDDIDPDAEDGKDAFAAVGLDVPFRWVSGNHDALVQGNFEVTAAQQTAVLGTNSRLGTRVYAGPGLGTVRTGDVVIADEARRLLDGPALLDLIANDGDGHGFGGNDARSLDARSAGRAFASFDVDNSPVTFVILDTSHARGGAEGVLRRSEVDRFVIPALDDALARDRIVVIASHHAVGSLSLSGGAFGQTEDDALSAEDWLQILGGYPNVLFSMVGHSHQNRVRVQQTPGHAFFEVMTSALADWPHQMRLVEIFDDDNGTLRMEATPVDYVADDDPLAALGRSLGLIDVLAGWNGSGSGAADERRISLIVRRLQ